MVFICNPNNPTGTIVTHAEVGAFLAALPENVIAVFDEAYMEFADIMGAAMPRGFFAQEVQRLLVPLVRNLLLPTFFVYSGLHTRIGLVDSPWLWGITLVVILAACLGKGVACWAAARLNGELPREALAIGALMNAHGLMELIILNIGLERGIITPTLFTIMVLMAIVTTMMASPIFEWVYDPAKRTTVVMVAS